jgi:iron complex transport system ATP-binding protein
MLKMQGVSFEIRGKQILKDINLEVRSGEVVGVVGKNGAGKSTAIHIASGIRRPTTGVVTYDGRDIEDISSQDLGKMRSVLSQSISLGLEVSVLDVALSV